MTNRTGQAKGAARAAPFFFLDTGLDGPGALVRIPDLVAGVLDFADGALDAATCLLGGAFAFHSGAVDNFADGLTGFAAGNIAGATGLVDRAGFHKRLFWVEGELNTFSDPGGVDGLHRPTPGVAVGEIPPC